MIQGMCKKGDKSGEWKVTYYSIEYLETEKFATTENEGNET